MARAVHVDSATPVAWVWNYNTSPSCVDGSYANHGCVCGLERSTRVSRFGTARVRRMTRMHRPRMMEKKTSPIIPVSPPPSTRISASMGGSNPHMLVGMLTRLATLDARLKRVKCPFWRRRFGEGLSTLSQIVQWAIRTRHKSLTLPTFLISPSRACGDKPKLTGLDLPTRLNILRDDYVKRQYFVTGRLSYSIYRDDCFFDGPDPDGRVRGTQKFADAAAGLFDSRLSRVDLIDIYEQVDDAGGDMTVVAHWRLEGALMLPWRPRIKPYVGSTRFKFDADGLVMEHLESWEISVFDAFFSVIWKQFGAPPAPSVEFLRQARKERGIQRWSPSPPSSGEQ